MSTIFKTVNTTLEYKATESSPIRSFLKNCISNEWQADSSRQVANLQTVAGVVCFILTAKASTVKEANDKTKQFIIDYFIKQGKEAPVNRMLNRRIQVARYVIKNNQHLKEFTTTPGQLIEESLKVVNKYGSYKKLIDEATTKKESSVDPKGEVEKLLNIINKLFDDIASLESNKESVHLMEYIRVKATAALTQDSQSESESSKVA